MVSNIIKNLFLELMENKNNSGGSKERLEKIEIAVNKWTIDIESQLNVIFPLIFFGRKCMKS